MQMSSRADSRPRLRRSIAPILQTTLRNGGDKENFAADAIMMKPQRLESQPLTAKEKKLRSKSLGPGGLDALKNGTGNRRKSVMPLPLKSILKPAIPVSPLQSIPTFEETRRKTPGRSPYRSNNLRNDSGLLIDFSTPPPSIPLVGTEQLANPFDAFNPTPARTAAALQSKREQKTVEREREARERHEREKQAALEQRAARRKSLANRRVSFAPEATLHTWNVIELMEESTASSAATNPTRRVSSLTTTAPEPQAPSTPDEENDDLEQFSPAVQGVFYQPSPERTSGGSQGELDTVENHEGLSSSPFSGDSTIDEEEEADTASLGPENDDTTSDSDMDHESTAMSLENLTRQSIGSSRSDSSTTNSSARLNQSLRLAAQIAGTNGIEYDENEDLPDEYPHYEITGAFKPWVKNGANRAGLDAGDLSSRLDQENVNPFRKSVGYPRDRSEDRDDINDETGMDFTRPMGGIIFKQNQYNLAQGSSETNSPGNERNTQFGATDAAGGDLSPRDFSGDSDIAEDEEMTMEFTSVVGGMLRKNMQKEVGEHRKQSIGGRDNSQLYPDLSELDMEMTGAIGGILPPIEERTEPLENEADVMDMTNAIGRILPSLRPTARSDRGDDSDTEVASSPFQENIVPSPPKPTTPLRVPSVPYHDESPITSHLRLKPRSSRNSEVRPTTPTKRASNQVTPVKRTPSPPKSRSPHTLRPATPATPVSTPPSRRVQKSPTKASRLSVQPSRPTRGSIFMDDGTGGPSTPKIVLTARSRSPSGLGADKSGLGSPRVAAILDRRRSIGDEAQAFTPKTQQTRGVRFNEPANSSQTIQHSGGHTVTATGSPQMHHDGAPNIREMISSLTPKKNRLKGRKSLHVGAAKGLLGKRPIELDMEDDEDNTPKRPRARETSPVKAVKLAAPPSMVETVGKAGRSTPSSSRKSPRKIRGSSPRETPQPRSVERNASERATEDSETALEPMNSSPEEFQALQLSEFLEMTNIHFMELTTTKRRHTVAPDANKRRSSQGSGVVAKDVTLEDCVAAGVCTLPVLELYQHSCRELKSYIAEGREIIRSIEAETYADNPPLFQEYVTAPPDIKLLMDNQFRNVKSHARLLSKSMWYEWRMKLLEGLKQGLDSHVEDMNRDSEVLSQKESLLNDVVPGLVEQHGKLEIEAHNFQKIVEEMENCDQEELKKARAKLRDVDLEVTQRKKELELAQASLETNSNTIKAATQQRTRLLNEMKEAERVLEECRGWSVKEVSSLQAAVQNIEKSSGWKIVSASQGAALGLCMRYKDQLQLDFYPEAFNIRSKRSETSPKNLPIALHYLPSRRGSKKDATLTPEYALMIYALRIRMTHLTQAAISPNIFLKGISQTWDRAFSIRNEIRMLEYCGVTKVKTVDVTGGDPALLKIRCILLGTRTETKRPKTSRSTPIVSAGGKVKARVDIDFTVKPRSSVPQDGASEPRVDVEMDVDVSAGKVYGFSNSVDESEELSEARISEFLMQTIQVQDAKASQFGKGLWRSAVKELAGKVFD